MSGGIDAAIYGQEALGDRGGLPAESSGGGHAFESLKTASILDTGYRDVHVEIAVFSDWEQGESYHVTVPAGRAKHLRFNDLGDTGRPQRGIDDARTLQRSI